MKNLTKKEIAEEIALRTGLTQVDTRLVVECFLDTVAGAMLEGRTVEIRGFGRFKVKRREARTARNPRTGEPIAVPPSHKPVFEPSGELSRGVNRVCSERERRERDPYGG